MADPKPHRLQEEPAEGSRETIERELARAAKQGNTPAKQDDSGSPGEAGVPKTR